MAERKNKVRPVIVNGMAKVPVIMQLEALECGAASLAMIMAYFGTWIPLEQVRIDCGVSRDGANAKSISLTAKKYGFTVESFRRSPKSIRSKGRFPCIIQASGGEDGFFGRWAGYQASVNTQAVKFSRVQNYLGSVPQLLTSISTMQC